MGSILFSLISFKVFKMLGRQARRMAILSRTSVPAARPKGPFAASVVSPCITSRSFITESTLVTGSRLENQIYIRLMSTGADLPAHEVVKLPALSPTMEQGTIVTWEKKVGDQLSEGDLLCEIETDKATMGFETPEEGYLAKILIEAGTKDIPIGKPLCIIVTEKEDIAKFESYQPPAESSASSSSSASPPPPPPPLLPTAPSTNTPTPTAAAPTKPIPQIGSARAFVSPAAKRLAAERGIDLRQVPKGSGMDGMITTKDVEGLKASATASTAATPEGRKLGGMPAPMGQHSDAEITNMRKTIAKRLQASKHEIPHYY